jgi:glycosyltransferase involved in cell wall biosynthesis
VKSVLLVSYTFPPQYDVSARRAAKLCKYLPATGWQPIVLTKDWARDVAPEDRHTYALVSHPEALDEVAGVTIVRTPYHSHDNALRRLHERLGGVYGSGARHTAAPEQRSEPASNGRLPRANGSATRAWSPRAIVRRALSLASPTFGDFPDAFRGWIDDAVRVGIDVATRHSVDAIVSLCPPASAHVVASEIARATGLPWVAQFDDLYSFHLERQRPAWRRYSDRRHRRWMSRATRAGAITPAMLEYVRRTYGVDGDVVVVGFDPDESPRVERRRGDRLRLAYTGSVYPGDQRPEIFFEALERMLQSYGTREAPIEVVFAGTGCDEELGRLLGAFPAAAQVCVFRDRLAPVDALRLQREADGLLLLNCTAPSAAEGTLSFPAKSFEYLHAGRPILAIPSDPGGWGDRLLDTTGAGVTAGSAADAAAVLERWVTEWRSSGALAYAGKPGEIARYSQPRQAATLGRLLDQAVAARRDGHGSSRPARGLR